MNGCEPQLDSPAQAGRPAPGLRRAAWLIAILALCAMPPVWLIARSEMIARDGTLYVRMAREWRGSPRQVVNDYDYHVGYPVAVDAVQRVRSALGGGATLRDWELSGRLVSLAAALAAIAGLWVFAGLTFGWRVAAIAAVIFGMGRKWVELGADVLSDSLAICFQMWALVLAVMALRALRRKSRWALAWAVGVGLCGGLGYLVRPESLLGVALAGGLWVAFGAFKPASWRLTLASVGAAAVTAAACAMPYALAIGGLTKKKSLSEIVGRPSSAGGPLAMMGISGPDVLPAMGQVAYSLLEAMHLVLALLAALWLAAWAADRIAQGLGRPAAGEMLPLPRPAGALLMAGACLCYGGVAFGLYTHVHYLSHRHVMFLAMVLSPLAAAGIVTAAQALARVLRVPIPWRRMVLALAVAAVAAGLARSSRHPLHESKVYFRQAGERLAALAGERDFVASDTSWALYYSQRSGVVLPVPLERLTPAELTAWLKAAGVTWLALDDKETDKASAEMRAAIVPPRFVEAAAVPSTTLREPDTVRIYRIDGSAAIP